MLKRTPGGPKARSHSHRQAERSAEKIQGPFRKFLPQAATQPASQGRGACTWDFEAMESPSSLQTREAAGSTRGSGGTHSNPTAGDHSMRRKHRPGIPGDPGVTVSPAGGDKTHKNIPTNKMVTLPIGKGLV